MIWRQLDVERNSVSSLAQSRFPHKELQGKNNTKMKQMLENINVIWDLLPTYQRLGWCMESNGKDFDIPRFQKSRNYIEKHLEQIEK